jgi:enoyl-CoA hydratase/carnithine racemase
LVAREIEAVSDKLLLELDGHVATLTLNQPELRNPITDIDFVDAFVGCCARIQGDINIRCVILTGAGKGFSSGGNLKHMRDRIGTFSGSAAEIAENYRKGIQRIPKAMAELDVPIIAAVNGPAYGAGCDLVMMCDIRREFREGRHHSGRWRSLVPAACHRGVASRRNDADR